MPLGILIIGNFILPTIVIPYLGFVILFLVILSGYWNLDDWDYVRYGVEEICLNPDGSMDIKDFKINSKTLQIKQADLRGAKTKKQSITFKTLNGKFVLRQEAIIHGDWSELSAALKDLLESRRQ